MKMRFRQILWSNVRKKLNKKIWEGKHEDPIDVIDFTKSELYYNVKYNGSIHRNEDVVYIGLLDNNGGPHGKGFMKFLASGSCYEGDFQSGNFQGKGVWASPTGVIYQGEWVKGQLLGMCIVKSPDGATFEGIYDSTGVAVWGVMKYPNGDTYTGEIRNGDLHGTGVYKWRGGDQYVGDFEAGTFHGEGVKSGPNGYVYRGAWENGKRCGRGIEEYPDGYRYESTFIEDVSDDWGTLTFPNGDIYTGEFENDTFHGRGLYEWAATGETYEGNYCQGKRQGRGIFLDSHGRILYDGEWENDQPLVKLE